MSTSALSLPAELIDAIVDSLATQHTDMGLFSPSLVSSEWLRRSRYHLFSAVTLQHAHIAPFLTLLRARHSTLRQSIQSVTLDAGWRPTCEGHSLSSTLDEEFIQSVRLLVDPSLQNLKAFGFSSMDWSAFPPRVLTSTRHLLSTASFGQTLQHLNFANVTFHGARELLSLINLFPSILRLTAAGVSFLKYRDQLCKEAANGSWKPGMKEVEVDGKDGEDAVASLLSWLVAAHERNDDVRIERLSITGIRSCDIPLVRAVLKQSRPYLRHLKLGFGNLDAGPSEEDLLRAFKLSKMPELHHLSLEGIQCSTSTGSTPTTCATNVALPNLLSTLESPFLRRIDLGFLCSGQKRQSSDMKWQDLQKSLQELCFFGVNQVNIDLSAEEKGEVDSLEAVRCEMLQELSELHYKGIVNSHVQS